MSARIWATAGVHHGKKISELPITYLLWFVGSPIMRRTRWVDCRIALSEIYRRLATSTQGVEDELTADLRPRSKQEKFLIRQRRKSYRSQKRPTHGQL
jgi:hypothetical protein